MPRRFDDKPGEELTRTDSTIASVPPCGEEAQMMSDAKHTTDGSRDADRAFAPSSQTMSGEVSWRRGVVCRPLRL